MTDAQFLAWLKATARRCVLVEVGVNAAGSEITRYLSSAGYVTGAADTPANTVYSPIISGGARISESLTFSGASLSFGDIELLNPNGTRDAWLDDIWANRPIRVYVGDPHWPRADFRLVFDGVVADIDSQQRGRLNIRVIDKLQRLNTPLSETKLGGTTANADRLIPLAFGEVHNIEPLLIDPANHVYQVHTGAIESVIEVRDNGVPITVTPALASGTFTLTAMPFGTITASVQGDKPAAYTNTIAATIQRLATGYGKATDRLTLADIDSANFAAFAAANSQAIGLYVSAQANVLACCQQLAASVGAQLVCSREGLLRLLRIDFPPSGTPTLITPSQMLGGSLSIDERPSVQAAVTLAYCRNWTLQPNLQTGLPESSKDLFARDWLTVQARDASVASSYRLHVEPAQEDTLLIASSEAQTEATRRLNVRKLPRTVVQFTGFASLLMLVLGQAVTLMHPRFGLAAGKPGVVVGLSPDWINGKIGVKVMV